MIDLTPCSACRRHVRVDADACPFCGAPLAPVQARSVPAGRLTRAAVFAAGAALAGATPGCGGGEPAEETTDVQQTTGGGETGGGEAGGSGGGEWGVVGEEPVADAGVGEGPPDATPHEADVQDHDVAMPYGAPPARNRLV